MKITVVILALYLCPAAAAQALPFECGFEAEDWFKAWGLGKPPRNTAIVETDRANAFVARRGKALRVRIAKGSNYGTSLVYRFKKLLGAEPEAIFFRYYLRFGEDWDPKTGGKLPGFGGTYGRAGWGGRPVKGLRGWSARGMFQRRKDGKTGVGFYCYHADMKGKYGSGWPWDIALANNRWYCVEQYCRMNTPGRHDGILRAWVDGSAVFEKKDVRMRDTEALKIELIWFNVYHGGKAKATQDHHLYIDDVAIARKRIGPAPKRR